jgi:site-specific DNA-cytosine methylase
MLVFDFFSGTGSSTKAFEDAGHRVIRFENDTQFEAEEYVDINELTADYLIEKYGRPDFIWASPPCTAFSVASIGRHWHEPGVPKTQAADDSQKLVAHTLALIHDLKPGGGVDDGEPSRNAT